MDFLKANTLVEKLQLMKALSQRFLERAQEIDEKGLFPYENIKELIDCGYTTLVLPDKYGGADLSLYELVRLQEQIAIGDGATALSIGWHMGIIKNLVEKRPWDVAVFARVMQDVQKGALINSAASELQTGSPTRGGKPTTTVFRDENGWVMNGRKTFTTLAPVLEYFIVSATIKETDEVGNFLVSRSLDGVEIEETWDSVAMRGTGSHDLVLKNVKLANEDLLEKLQTGKKSANGGLLHIPACYLGIAEAAQNYAIDFAKTYSPNSIDGTIIDLPNVREKIGKMELLILEAKHFLYSIAKLWDTSTEAERVTMSPELGAVKYSVTNKAIQVVDLAMRVVGARSLSEKSPLQRYYRDVRAGLHNPPMDDATIQLLANKAVEEK